MLGSWAALRGWERRAHSGSFQLFFFQSSPSNSAKVEENRIHRARSCSRACSAQAKLSDVAHPLSELKIFSDGRTITVHFAGQKMEAITGQMLFDFETADLERLRPFSPSPSSAGITEREAEFIFQHGLTLEETGAPIRQATEAYKKPLS
jgi:hypothetical protein